MVEVLKQYGDLRSVVDSASDWGISGILGVLKTARARLPVFVTYLVTLVEQHDGVKDNAKLSDKIYFLTEKQKMSPEKSN